MGQPLSFVSFKEGYQREFQKLASGRVKSASTRSPTGGERLKNALLYSLLGGAAGTVLGAGAGAGVARLGVRNYLREATPAIGRTVNLAASRQLPIRKAIANLLTAGLAAGGAGVGGQVGGAVGAGMGAFHRPQQEPQSWMQSLMGKRASVKSALNPRFAGRGAAPFIDKELAALGERLFHDSHKAPGVWRGLKSVMLPGYHQLRDVHDLMGGPHTPDQLAQAFTAIGSTAQPRIDMFNRGVPLALGAGGAGLVASRLGRDKGQMEGQQDATNTMSQLPLMERLKYMISPSQYMHPTPNPNDTY